MSFFDKIWCCTGKNVVPDKDFTMVLGEGLNNDKKKGKKKKNRYGTAYERMTSPGREYMREQILTPQANKGKAKIINQSSKMIAIV